MNSTIVQAFGLEQCVRACLVGQDAGGGMAVVMGKGSMDVNRNKSASTDQKREVGKDGEGEGVLG